MVQRKSPDKLCVPAETKKNYVKSDKRSTTHKPASSSSSSSSSSSHNHDTRNKGGGTDLKKKLKKSRSLKLLDFESLESSPVKEEKSRTYKAPNSDLSVTTPQRSSMIKISENSPNYMKSTSSSNARKERSPVSSSRSYQTCSDSTSLKRRNSNNSKSSSSPSGDKLVRSLTKKNSLKPVRTLTKTSSIKAVKPLMKKSSGVALNQNLNVGRATCSSTLKDSKFPDYLMISPGGTESEGTSVAKVCPYTYCSLNGHHHAPLPPLKCFMSARRRSLRTQRSLRLRCLSPVGTKLSAKTEKKIDTGQMDLNEDSANLEAVSTGSVISPQIGMDFFVEIYAKPRENTDGFIIGRSNYDGDEKEKINVNVIPEARDDFLSSVTDGAETELEKDENALKGMPNESSYSEISFDDILDQDCDFPMTEMDITEHNQLVEVEETEYPSYSVQAEADLECCCIETKSESIVPVDAELDESVAEAAEMDWEEGNVVIQIVKDGSDSSNLNNGDILQETFEEKIENFVVDSVDSESYGGDLMSEIDVSSDIVGVGSITSIDQLSFTEDSSEEQTEISEEKDEEAAPDNFDSSSKSSVEDPFAEITAASEEKNGISKMETDFILGNFLPGDVELPCSAEETYRSPKEEDDFQDDALIEQNLSLGNPDINAEVEPQQSEPEDPSCELGGQTFEAVNSKTDQDLATSGITLDQSLPTADVGVGAEGKEEVGQDSGEKHNNETAQMHTEIELSQCEPTQEDDNCGTVVENLLPPTQGQLSDDQSSSSNMVENQELPAKDQSEGMDLSFSSSTHAEEHNDPESYVLISAETGIIENIQVADKVGTDAAETCLSLTQSNVIGAEEKKKMMNARRNSHQQVTEDSCSNLKISIRRKEQIKESEELREFNPREPNYLPVEPDPEAEKVDLKQQIIDERRNSEEWMLDYALRKAVNELAPARKRRVALLVEAFETVTPQPKCESRIRHVMQAFSHTRPMQACI
ncbi:Calmodulin-binding domain [Macleaya cordata]|uniref:Calmodulin-binding domain n=1 Tax=Macleaya cordata TaxID=56857 RepID=A0A200QIS6_MACCD|nr:Calmodulin-binding domain [Macleaya cordata]